jgi:pimeloyl-ACP methyl ester carboxylesterase
MLNYDIYKHPTAMEWVTFVHGAGGSSSIWFKQIRAFSEVYNVLLLDLRGHGKSKSIHLKQFKRYSFDVVREDVMEVLNHLCVEKSHFVGISLGTIVIRDIAEHHPHRISSMILGGAVMKLNVRGQVLMQLGKWFKSFLPYLILYRLFAFIVMPKRSHRDSRNLFIREAKKLYQNEFKRWFTMVSEINPLLALFRIRETSIPTLFVMGSEDHMFLPSIKKLVESHSSSTLSIIPNCGHVVNVEAAHTFNSIALQFIATIQTGE